MKKVFSAILCLALILSLAMSASAVTVTINGAAADAEYSAYKLLDAAPSADNASVSYGVNADFKEFFITYFGIDATAMDDDQLSQKIVTMMSDFTSNSTELNAFARAAYEYIGQKSIQPVNVNDKDAAFEVGSGYYLIAETAMGADKGDTRSLHMLNTVGNENITIVTKESAPTVEKEVKGKNDSTGEAEHFRNYADYDVGDIFQFRITGTLSGRYNEYKNYYYEFNDTMSAGLIMHVDESNAPIDMKITIGDVDVTGEFVIKVRDDKKGFTAYADLKAIDAKLDNLTISHGSSVVVTYYGKLTEDGVVYGGAGNPNEITLKYQRDPYAEGNPGEEEKGVTPPDKAVVFTYEGVLNKVKEDGTTALAGATFKLEKFYDASGSWVTVKEIGPKDGAAPTEFKFQGLDAGLYRLSEVAPDGYYPIAPFEFKVVPAYNTATDPATLTDLQITDRDGDPLEEALKIAVSVSDDKGTFTSTIVNKPGKELPTTGGMGTTLIYAAGGILVLAAIILLVTKKRMSNAD